MRHTDDNTAPLWQTVVGDTEPWRRGRLALIIVAILTALLQGVTFTPLVLAGAIEAVAINAAVAALFWLQFYFIWIGIQWVRWLQGAVCICFGFTMLIWGMIWGAYILIPVGLYSFLVGSYIGFAPAVYFFAIHQRERRDWRIALAVAAVFLLISASLGALIFGLSRYRIELESRARSFADTAFRSIYTDHDIYFLMHHATQRLMSPPYGQPYLSAFLQNVTIQAGDVRDISRATGNVALHYRFPTTFFVAGEMRAQGMSEQGRINLRLGMGGVPAAWQIDAVGWWIPEPVPGIPGRR